MTRIHTDSILALGLSVPTRVIRGGFFSSRFVAAALAAGVTGWIGSPARADLVTVYVFSFDFSINPPGGPIVDAVVNPGDTIRWHFLDSGHSATSVPNIPEVFDSGYVGVVGTTYDHTFTHPGTWWYYCFPHGNALPNGTAAGMAGTITVLPAPGVILPVAAALMWAARRRRA
ncbi:MAG: hypothetical protein ACKVU4_10910 [Phycisphaerales bacterium]